MSRPKSETSVGTDVNQRPLQGWAQVRDLCESESRPGTSTETGLNQRPPLEQT